MTWGLLAEFAGPDALVAAAARVRERGYTRWDAHTPFPVHGLDAAMGIRPTRLPWLVLGAGIAGCAGGLLMEWWMNAVAYPLIISGKPFNSLPASIPVAFELTILLASLTAFGGMILGSRLPQLHHPLFASRDFARSTTDAFFIAVEAGDPKFDPAATEALLREAGAVRIVRVER